MGQPARARAASEWVPGQARDDSLGLRHIGGAGQRSPTLTQDAQRYPSAGG